jgi:hypothetical protein
MEVNFMKFKLFLAVLGALAFGPALALFEDFIIPEESILSKKSITPKPQFTGEEIDKFYFDYKDEIFGAKNNPNCKPNDPFCESQCHYDTSVAYDYFKGKDNSEWSLIPDRSFKDETELNKWACNQTKNTYLIAYKPGCPPCAALLAAIETRMQNLKEENINVYKINPYQNRQAFSDKDWKFKGTTPTIWKISNGSVYEVKNEFISNYNAFIFARKENPVNQNPMQQIKNNINHYGFGYFKHDEKVAAAAVCAALCYGGYKGYKLAKKWYAANTEDAKKS